MQYLFIVSIVLELNIDNFVKVKSVEVKDH